MLYISTNIYTRPEEFQNIFALLDLIAAPVGIEIFPLWQFPEFEIELQRLHKKLAAIPTSFHGPYYQCEPSAPAGSSAQAKMLLDYQKTFTAAQMLQSNYIVHHHNNKNVEDKALMLQDAEVNLQCLLDRFGTYNVPLLIENAGVGKNSLFTQTEFIQMAQSSAYPILIDVGHVHANGWDIAQVVQALAPQIKAYHLHNNDGLSDAHQPIFEGSFKIEQFFKLYKEYTPEADLILEYASHYAQCSERIRQDALYCIAQAQ